MFHGKLMIRPHDRPLEKRPDVLKRVGMRKAANVFTFAMVNANMDRFVVADSDVCAMLIGRDDFGFIRKFRFDKFADHFMANVLTHRLKSYLAAAFDCAHNRSLAAFTARTRFTPQLVALVHPFHLAADICLIAFNKARIKTKQRGISILNRFADTVTEIPRCLVSDAENALELQSRDTLFRFANQISSDEPFTQGKMRIMENSSRCHREVIAAWCTLKLIALVIARDFLRAATDAANAFRPAKFFKRDAAFFVSVE